MGSGEICKTIRRDYIVLKPSAFGLDASSMTASLMQDSEWGTGALKCKKNIC